MQWNSVGEFFAMGGYGFYVWGSFGVTALAMLIEPLLLRKRQNDVVNILRRERSADERQKTPV
ncbi:MAG: heme exporter protein CcmD [Proteobacteria bacterium]|nr:heme exporter protein CcmD [Pseudomonadota bacterium]